MGRLTLVNAPGRGTIVVALFADNHIDDAVATRFVGRALRVTAVASNVPSVIAHLLLVDDAVAAPR